MEDSQKFVQASDLSRRVQQWEARIRPILDEESTHAPFDIHTYGIKEAYRSYILII